MAHQRYTGRQVRITIGAITGHFRTIAFTVTKEKYTAKSSDSDVQQRGTQHFDASITIVGWDTDAATGATLAEFMALLLSDTELDALDFTDDAGTPADKLPASFWTKFPLEGWSVDQVQGGDYGSDPAQVTLTLSPNNLDLTPAA